MRVLRPVVVVLALTAVAATAFLAAPPGEAMTAAATAWLESLSADARETALLPYDTPRRVEWHFVPQETRKGLPLGEMTPPQRTLAHTLLSAALSEAGYDTATSIMHLEDLLRSLEGDGRRWPRDSGLYYFTIFGTPSTSGRWGLSVEGHHLSLNFVVEQGQVVSSTPQFLGANPATIKTAGAGFERGQRVLGNQEQLGFDLLALLDGDRRTQAVIAAEAPAELRGPADAQPPTEAAQGLAVEAMTLPQQKLLRRLIGSYADAMPQSVAAERLAAIEQAGYPNVKFAWLGAETPGIGHAYRVQGPTFLIEFVNVQPDAQGNPANHIHTVWRYLRGDFGIPVQ